MSAAGEGEGAPAGISVIIVTLNEERNIRGCLASLLAQDYPAERRELLVVDASTDETANLAAAHGGVRVVRAAKGFSSQKNAGLREARFDLLAFTDADCLIPPGWLSAIDRAFRDPRLAAAGGNAYPPPGTRGFGLWSACVGHPSGGAIGFDANVAPSAEGVAFAAGCNSVFRKSALRAVGGFHPDFEGGGEDVDVSRRLRKAGYFLDYIPDMTVYHKPRPTLRSFFRWNVGVGGTKYSLRRPGAARILFNPFFPAWPPLVLAGLLALPPFPWIPLASLAGLWAGFVFFLAAATRPFPLLWRRRRKIGISTAAVLLIVPGLVFVRQTGISLGEWRRRRALRTRSRGAPSSPSEPRR